MSLTSNDRRFLAYWDSWAGAWRPRPPASPTPEDIGWYQSRIEGAWKETGAGQFVALLLGVTPQISRLDWPTGTVLVGLDWSAPMLRTVWRDADSAALSQAVCADWRALPIASASVDLVLADGGYTAMGSFDRAQAMNREIRRVLRPGGHYCVRAFARPQRAETMSEVMHALTEGGMQNATLFRWRFAMALRVRSREGVRIGAIWDAWCDHAADPQALAARNGWTGDELAAMENYRDVEARYYFPSRAELRELAGHQFEWLGVEYGGFECGDRFPRIAMRAR